MGGTVHADTLSPASAEPEQDVAYNLPDLDRLVSQALGAEGRLIYGDLTVHPKTRDAYVSVTGMVDGGETAAVVSIARDGTVQRLDLDALASTRFALNGTADDDVSF